MMMFYLVLIICMIGIVQGANTELTHFPNENTDPARVAHFNEAYRMMTGKAEPAKIYDLKSSSMTKTEAPERREKREAFNKIKDLIGRRKRNDDNT